MALTRGGSGSGGDGGTGTSVLASAGTFDAALKEFYLPRLLSTINTKRILSEVLRRDASLSSVDGRRAVVPVNIRGSQAMGARGDNATLPTPSNQTYVQVNIPYAYNYATIRITHPTIASSKTDKGSFIRAIGAEMDGIRRDLKNDVNRQFFGDGSGFLTRVNDATSSGSQTAVTMDKDLGRCKVGMLVQFADAKAGGTVTYSGASTEITAVSSTQVTFGTGREYVNNDFVFRDGARNNEMMGLLGIVDNGLGSSGADGPYVNVLYGVDRDTYPEWQARVNHNSGTDRAITSAIIDTALLDVQEASEGETSLIISDVTQYRKAAHLLTGDRRYTPSMQLEGGFTALDWAGIPWVWDRDCEVSTTAGDGMVFLLDTDDLMLLQLQDWDFDDTDGSVLHRVQGYNYYDATLFYYGNLGCTDPGNQAVIRDLTT